MQKVVHFEVPTKDLDRAQQFYTKVFGWKMVPMPDMNYTVVHTVEVDDDNMPKESGAINGGMTTDDPAKGCVLVINVDSVNDFLKKIKQAGGTVFMKKTKVGDMGYYARFTDPEGNVVGIWEDAEKPA